MQDLGHDGISSSSGRDAQADAVSHGHVSSINTFLFYKLVLAPVKILFRCYQTTTHAQSTEPVEAKANVEVVTSLAVISTIFGLVLV